MGELGAGSAPPSSVIVVAMSDRIAAWWRRTRPLLHPFADDGTPTPALDELTRSIAAAMPRDLGARVALPDDFARYLATIGPHGYLSQELGLDFHLYSVHRLVPDVAYNAKVYDDEPDRIRRAGPWLPFAARGRDEYSLCVDATSPRFGQVLRGEDAHPWGNELDGRGYDGLTLCGPLVDWLDSLKMREGCWRVIALEPGELAALESARRAGAWDLIVAARDLALTLTPDRVFRPGAPDRIATSERLHAIDELIDKLGAATGWIRDHHAPGGVLILSPASAAAAAVQLATDAAEQVADHHSAALGRAAGVLARGATVVVIRDPDPLDPFDAA